MSIASVPPPRHQHPRCFHCGSDQLEAVGTCIHRTCHMKPILTYVPVCWDSIQSQWVSNSKKSAEVEVNRPVIHICTGHHEMIPHTLFNITQCYKTDAKVSITAISSNTSAFFTDLIAAAKRLTTRTATGTAAASRIVVGLELHQYVVVTLNGSHLKCML